MPHSLFQPVSAFLHFLYLFSQFSFYDTILRCEKIFDNLVLEREFVAEKLKKLEGVAGQENEIRNTKEYLATTRYIVE